MGSRARRPLYNHFKTLYSWIVGKGMHDLVKIHHPPHLFIPDAYYSITARTYHGRPVFAEPSAKLILFHALQDQFQRSQTRILAWVILDNHYHIQTHVRHATAIPKKMQFVHGRTSFQINAHNGTRRRKIFQNYWDRLIRNEKDFSNTFNYIHHNPVKHGYVQTMEEYACSSYRTYVRSCGREFLESCFEKYPIVDWTSGHVHPKG